MTPYAHSVRHITREAVPNRIFANKRFEEILSMNDKQQSATISFDLLRAHAVETIYIERKNPSRLTVSCLARQGFTGDKTISPLGHIAILNVLVKNVIVECKNSSLCPVMQTFETNDYMFQVAVPSNMCMNTAVTRRQIAK